MFTVSSIRAEMAPWDSSIAEFPCTIKLRSEEKGHLIVEELERVDNSAAT